MWPLVSQLLSSLCSAAGKHFTTVSGGHSLKETVLLLAMKLLGLISSLHYSFLLYLFANAFLRIAYQFRIILKTILNVNKNLKRGLCCNPRFFISF